MEEFLEGFGFFDVAQKQLVPHITNPAQGQPKVSEGTVGLHSQNQDWKGMQDSDSHPNALLGPSHGYPTVMGMGMDTQEMVSGYYSQIPMEAMFKGGDAHIVIGMAWKNGIHLSFTIDQTTSNFLLLLFQLSAQDTESPVSCNVLSGIFLILINHPIHYRRD